MTDVTDLSAEVLLDATPDAVLLADSEGTITYANDRVRDLFGYEPDRLIGEPVERLVPGRSSEGHATRRDTYLSDPEQRAVGMDLDPEARCADGSTAPVDIRLSPLDGGDDVQILAAVRDVSERREHRQRISRLREATTQLIDAETETEVAEMVATTATDLFGYESSVSRLTDDEEFLFPVAVEGADMLGMDVRPAYPIDDDNPVARVYESGEPEWYDDIQTLADGYDRGDARAAMYIPIGSYGVLSVLDSDAGSFDHHDRDLASNLATNAATILDRIHQENELQRQIDRLDEFADLVSHDLRNPLNIAQLQLEAATESETALEKASDALDRMEEIIEYTLTLAREGNAIGETEPVALDAIARECWTRFDTEQARLALADTPRIHADPERLRHIFENLFDNAVDHAGPDVLVRVGELDDASGFYVADDGPGIPEADREAIFKRGYTTTSDGTGFGLLIVDEIVDAHGWEISVTDSVDGGARFEIASVTVDS